MGLLEIFVESGPVAIVGEEDATQVLEVVDSFERLLVNGEGNVVGFLGSS